MSPSTRRSTLALPAAGCVWASACTSARLSSASTIQSNMTDFHPRACTMLFPSILLKPSHGHSALEPLPALALQSLSNSLTLLRYHFPLRFVTQGFTAKEVVHCAFSPLIMSSTNFHDMLTQESYVYPFLGPTPWPQAMACTSSRSDLRCWK